MKVIGVGFGRTGTLSLKAALERLGAGPCFHMLDLLAGPDRERDVAQWVKVIDGEPVDWAEVFGPWRSSVDWPGCTRWREIVAAFPSATVLLNVRDFDAFHRSCTDTLLAVREAAQGGQLPDDGVRNPTADAWRIIDRLVWEEDFGGCFADKEVQRRRYADRIAEIVATVPPERLVVWNLGVDGWEPLAAALGVPVPDEPFPHLHDTAVFRAACGLPSLQPAPEAR